jgi:predicted RNA methylase
MAKISRDALRRHDAACALLAQDRDLTADEIGQVIDDWHEGAGHANSRTGAHFTPYGLGVSMAVEAETTGRVLDLCAGIGTLSYAHWQHMNAWASTAREGQEKYTLVETNPDYAAVARRLLPGAEVIVGSAFDPVLIAELRSRDFDVAISNPPYGRYNAASGKGPRYRGGECHYAVIDVASELCRRGVFLIPQNATPFRYSGRSGMATAPDHDRGAYDRFSAQTGVEFEFNSGIDTAYHKDEWRDVSIAVEIVLADFVEAAARRRAEADQADVLAGAPAAADQLALFDIAA